MKYLIITFLLLLTGCSALDEMISPSGLSYEKTSGVGENKPYVDKRTPEQIQADRERVRKYLEEQDALYLQSRTTINKSK